MTGEAPATGAGGVKGPWGPWMSLLFGFVVFIAYSTAQGVALLPWVLARAAAGASPQALQEAALTGMNLAFATLFGCPILLLACGLLAWARQGPAVAEYLAIRRVRIGPLAGWVVTTALLAVGLSALNHALGRPPPEFIVSSYATAGYMPLFWAAIAVCAPVGEEVLFRGFLFAGLAASRLGQGGTVVATSVLFAVVHGGQYGWMDLAQVGLMGVAFGLARARTGSLVAPVSMHVALNLIALTMYELESAPGL